MSDNRAIFPNQKPLEEAYAYGFAHYVSGSWTKAAETFKDLCTSRPFEPKFWFGFAATLQEAGHYADALPSWAMAALLKPEDPYSHFHAAECHFSLENCNEAFKALKEVELRIGEEHPLKNRVTLLKEQWKG